MLAFWMATGGLGPSILRAMRSGLPASVGPRPALSPTSRQALRFCAVGGSGYAVNLAVYASLLTAGVHYVAAATASFLVAASSNYVLNRQWTFDARRERLATQSLRALAVSGMSLGANQLCLLALVDLSADHLAAQAVAIILVTPFSFVANKLWAFGESRGSSELTAQPAES
jgi:putative flippase GtrA